MEVLHHRAFRWYAAGSAVSLVGTWAQRIALGWVVWELTGSAAWLGALALADAGPIALLALVGGALGDRSRTLRLIGVTLAVSSAAAAALCAVTLAALPAAVTLTMILGLTLANGVATALGQPARMALVPRLVPRADVPAAVALGSVSFSLARLLGPLVGGALLAGPGAAAVFALNALSYLVFLLMLVPLRRAAGPGLNEGARREASPAGLGGSIAQALAQAWGSPCLLAPLALTGFGALCVRPYVELLPAVAAELLAAGPGALALLASATGAGALLGGLAMVRRAAPPQLWGISLAASAGSAGALAGLALTGSLGPALLWAGVLGVLLVCAATAAQSLIQLEAPEQMRGRLTGLYLTVLRTAPALGALLVGFAAEVLGLRAALLGAAAVGLLLIASTGFRPGVARGEISGFPLR